MNNEHLHSESSHPDDELSLQEAVDQVAHALKFAKSPLFVGLENLSTEAQQAVMRLARTSNATVDSSSDNLGRGNMFALQKRGRVTATLGEIRNRSNLIIFWFCDPVADHPDFFEQYVGENCRTVVVDGEENATRQLADSFIQLSSEQSVQAIWTIRAKLKNVNIAESNLPGEMIELANEMARSQYGAILWGSEHVDPEYDLQADGLHAMVRELNQFTRFVGIPYRRDANGLSAENVSTWASGFPFAVNWNREQPRQYWLEYSDLSISERDEWDFLLSFEVGEITIASQASEREQAFQMCLPVAQFGVDESGDACRFDDVSFTLHASEATNSPTTVEIVSAIQDSYSNRSTD